MGVADGGACSSGPPSQPPPCQGGRSVGGQGGGVWVAGGMGVGSSRSSPSLLFLPLPCRGRVGVGVAALRRMFIRTPLPTSPLSGGRSVGGQGGGVWVAGGDGRRRFPPLPFAFVSPSPLQGEECRWPGGRSMGGQGVGAWVAGGMGVGGSRPSPSLLFLPLPCRGRVGVGVAALRRCVRTPLPASPLSGGRSVGGRGEEYGWPGGWASAVPAPPLRFCFSLSLAGGGSGWGSPALRRMFIRTPLPTSPLLGGRRTSGQGGRSISGQGERGARTRPTRRAGR